MNMITRNGKWFHAESEGMQSGAYFLKNEVDFYRSGQKQYDLALAKLSQLNLNDSNDADLKAVDTEIADLTKMLEALDADMVSCKAEREELQQKTRKLEDMAEDVDNVMNQLVLSHNGAEDERETIAKEHDEIMNGLQTLMHINVYNDAFYIWFNGPFGTINGLRLGRLPFLDPVVEWSEINSALGFAALAVDTIALKLRSLDFKFLKYKVIANGSASCVCRADESDRVAPMNLFTDGHFGMFTGNKSSFNKALSAFLLCIDELGAFVSTRDPTIPVPHTISHDGSKIRGIPIGLGNDWEAWTTAMKALLTNLKWIIAWTAKHLR